MPLTFKGAFPVFTSMMIAGVLLVPTACGAKFARLGYGVRKGPFTPVPLRGTASGLILVLSVTVMEPDSRPVAVGVKLTVTAQWAPNPRLTPQLFAWLKFPFAAMLAMLKLTLLGLLIVMVWAAPVVPTPWDPKLSEAGEMDLKGELSITETATVATPYPVPAATSGDPSWLKSIPAMRLPDRKLKIGC
jgi:hypothetical protein